MMSTISLQDARANLVELIHRLSPGEEIVITDNDRPVAKLTVALPAQVASPKLGTQPGTVLSMERFDDPLDDFEDYTE